MEAWLVTKIACFLCDLFGSPQQHRLTRWFVLSPSGVLHSASSIKKGQDCLYSQIYYSFLGRSQSKRDCAHLTCNAVVYHVKFPPCVYCVAIVAVSIVLRIFLLSFIYFPNGIQYSSLPFAMTANLGLYSMHIVTCVWCSLLNPKCSGCRIKIKAYNVFALLYKYLWCPSW